MRAYRYDIDKTIGQLMPFFLVKPKHKAWLESILVPIRTGYADFLVYRKQQLKNATVNSQVDRFTQALRDQFSDDQIHLVHLNDYLDSAYIYLSREGASPEFDYLAKEAHQPVGYDFTDLEYGGQYDFIIRIPMSLSGSSSEILAFAKKYVFTGINYTTETF